MWTNLPAIFPSSGTVTFQVVNRGLGILAVPITDLIVPKYAGRYPKSKEAQELQG